MQNIELPLYGEWRHSKGYIICGTVRIAVQDFDTDPSEEFKKEILDWICETLNREVDYQLEKGGEK